MCYIANKIEYNGCGKIISELNKKWMFRKSFKTMPNERRSHSKQKKKKKPYAWRQEPIGWGRWFWVSESICANYMRVSVCVCMLRVDMTVTPPTDKQINIIHIPTYYTKQTREKNCDCEFIIVKVSVCLIVCIHPVFAGTMLQAIQTNFNGIFISTQTSSLLLLFCSAICCLCRCCSQYLRWLPFHLSRCASNFSDYIIFWRCHWYQLANMHCKMTNCS